MTTIPEAQTLASPEPSEAGQTRALAVDACYALFAFGHCYPNGGIADLRGTYATIEECRAAFKALGKTLMGEQGYGATLPGGSDCTGQIVELKTLRCVETLTA